MKFLLTIFIFVSVIFGSAFGSDSFGSDAEQRPIPYDVDYFLDEVLPRGGMISREDLNGGILVSSVVSGNNAVRGMVIQTDGRIVAAGRYSYGASEVHNGIAIIRYLPDGQLDTSYNSTGKATATFAGSGDDVIHGAVLMTNGTVTLGGKTNQGAANMYNFAVVRFTTSGVLDTAFSSDGKVAIDFGNGGDVARAIAVDTDARVVLGGYSNPEGTTLSLAMARLLSNGVLDTTFETDGRVIRPLLAQDSYALAVKIQTDGQIVAGGPGYNGTNFDMAIARFDSSGVLDTSFNSNGKAFVSFSSGATDLLYGVGITTVGDIVAAGSSNAPSIQFNALVRFKSNGSLDTTFSSDGLNNNGINGSSDCVIFALQIGSEDRILAGGAELVGGNLAALARYTTDGKFDTTFNSSGVSLLAFTGSTHRTQAIGYYDDSNIFVGGRSTNGSFLDFGIIRYNWDGTIKKSGDLDLSFGT